MQIAGILGLILFIFEMGKEALIISLLLILGGVFVYWFYGRMRGYREYALLHLIETITAKELTTYSLEAELKEIIKERDKIVRDRFDEVVEHAHVLDIDNKASADDFFKMAAGVMAGSVGLKQDVLLNLLIEREKESSTAITPFLAIPHIVIDGHNTFTILLARSRQGIFFSEEMPQVHAVFVLLGTKDERNFHLVSLAAIAQIVHESDFEKRWMGARNKEALRDIILLGQRKRPQ